LWTSLKDSRDWDVLEFPDVPQGGALEILLRLAQADGCPTGRVRSMNSPYVSLSGWDGREDHFLRQVNSSFASAFRRRRRKLTAQGPLVLRASKDADPDLLRLFFDLEASGWKGHQGTAISNDQRHRQFYEEVARGLARFGYLRLHFLEHHGKAIAGHIGFSYRQRYSTPKGARHEEYDRYGPGHLLTHAVLRKCAEEGLAEFDFLCEDDPWKLSWTSQVRPHAHLFIFRKNPRGRLAHLGKFQFKPVLRAFLGKRNLAR
jgi:CelD/BcsL family acetyltransferase involved in cellulose biosynthesis